MELPANLQSQLASLTAGLPGGSGGQRREYMSLNDTLSRDVLNRVLQMPGIGERLRPGLPENWDTDETGIREVIQSPQFQQVLWKFMQCADVVSIVAFVGNFYWTTCPAIATVWIGGWY